MKFRRLLAGKLVPLAFDDCIVDKTQRIQHRVGMQCDTLSRARDFVIDHHSLPISSVGLLHEINILKS